MPPHLIRLAYVAEFLLALMTVLTFWSEIGGQGHLDLMPWYTKLLLSLGLATATVLATAAAVAHSNAWNSKTLRWLGVAAAILAAMAATTYYYHLHENDDQQDEPDSPNPVALARPSAPMPGGFLRLPRALIVARFAVPAMKE